MTRDVAHPLTPGALYAVWDGTNQIVAEYLGRNRDTGLPEFRPLVWRGRDAEPARTICAGPRAQVQPIQPPDDFRRFRLAKSPTSD